jgi:hypothetical protein
LLAKIVRSGADVVNKPATTPMTHSLKEAFIAD